MSQYPSQQYGGGKGNTQSELVTLPYPPSYSDLNPQAYPQVPPPAYGDNPSAPGYYQPAAAGGYPVQNPAYSQGGAVYPQSAAYPQSGGFPQTAFAPVAGFPRANYPGATGPNVTSGSNLPHYESNASDISDTNDQASTLDNWKGFTEKAVRHAFIRKVYAILLVQLSFTTGMIALFIFQKDVGQFVRHNMGIYIAAYVTFLVVYIMLLCCGNLRRSYPTNYILLALFTLAFSYLAATISSFHDVNTVLIAMGICASCCLGITLFSFQTKFDFTQCGGVLFILSWVLFMFAIIAAFTFRTVPILHTVYAGLGALLFMAFLAYDTQMLMGGKKYQLSAEEHVYAALQLYLDVVQIFLLLLALMGGGKK